jgi:hypothetical protein
MWYDSIISCNLDARDSRDILGLSQRGQKGQNFYFEKSRSVTLKNQWNMNPLCQSQAHRSSRYGKKRWHHHHHKKYNHLDLHHRDWMPRGNIGSYLYLLSSLAWIIFNFSIFIFLYYHCIRKENNFLLYYKNPKPHVSKSTVCKHPWKYSLWWHKNKNIMHTYFLFCIWKIRKSKKYYIDILLKPYH